MFQKAQHLVILANILKSKPRRTRRARRGEKRRSLWFPSFLRVLRAFRGFTLSGFGSGFRFSKRKSQLRGAPPRGRGVPLPRGRVARIVPKFCARVTRQTRITPCAGRNKEYFTRGALCLFHCCTNVDSRTANGQHKHRHPRGGGERATAWEYRVYAALGRERRQRRDENAGAHIRQHAVIAGERWQRPHRGRR